MAKGAAIKRSSLSVRIDFYPGGRIGPGKIELLEKIAALGSISAAGEHGGGATLTPFGLALVARYRAIERAAFDAARIDLDALQTECKLPRE